MVRSHFGWIHHSTSSFALLPLFGSKYKEVRVLGVLHQKAMGGLEGCQPLLWQSSWHRGAHHTTATA